MKKILVAGLLLIMLFTFPISASAQTVSFEAQKIKIISETTEYFADGTSITTTIWEESSTPLRAMNYTKTGNKSISGKDSSGNILFTFTVKGTFSVNAGVSATCTATSYSTSNLASGWSLKTASTYASSNQAIGDATFEHKVLFIVTETRNCHVVLTCDVNGNLS